MRHDGDQAQQRQGQQFVQGVQGAALQPLGDGGPGVAEA